MKRSLTIASLALTLLLALASPAMAANASDGAGAAFGRHHATHAQEMGGFSGDHNPGVHHRGFSGWHHM